MGRVLQVVIAALIGAVVLQLLTGRIRTKGLLHSVATAGLSPERVQMLVVWLAGLGAYAAQVLASLGTPARTLPAVPESLLLGMGGSQLLYLIGKLARQKGR